ncbi:MAG TPA: cyclic nucleotide-binding domain-containing protein [Kofleriaceae bacterium]|nr:cyclic nucleotide-binding domain-containing protein [Kofleriaceae bacterium]
MTKLKELEQRLRHEPDNLGLRVMVAGALHEAGRRADAVELYRSVAVAYRDQGRPQQAITVCRSILELAPDDAACQELLAALLANPPAPRGAAPLARPSPSPLPVRPSPSPLPRPSTPDAGASADRTDRTDRTERQDPGAPVRPSTGEMTPLPPPLAYHDADPTTGTLRRLTPADLPPTLREELAALPQIAGIAAAARQISASLIAASRQAEEQAERTQELDDDDLAAEVDTGPHWRPGSRTAPSAPVAPPRAAARPPTPPPVKARPPTPPLDTPTTPPDPGDDDDDEPTLPPPPGGVPRPADDDNDKTEPREMPTRVRPPSIAPPTAATGPLAGAFFAPLPPRNRAAVLQRCRRRMIGTGTSVIRRGEADHGLVIVVRGRLDLHAERADGVPIALGAIGPGEFIGEASLLAGRPAAADAIAAADCELLVLAADDFQDVVQSFPALRAELEAVAARRTRDHEQRLRG